MDRRLLSAQVLQTTLPQTETDNQVQYTSRGMGVLNMFASPKTMNVPVEGIVLPHPSSPSPAVSSISSYGSGAFLIHGHQPKAGHKRKTVSLTVGRKHGPTRITNIIWSGLFLMVIIATVIVVAALAENIRRNLWTRVSFKDDGKSFHSITTLLDDAFAKIQPEEETSCIYRRIIWEHGSRSSEIIHDLSSKWSAVVDHDEERCLVFFLQNSKIQGCPMNYPWDMDLQVGVPGCRGQLARIAPIRKIMHHMCSTPVNLTATGEAISTICLDYKIFYVDKVVIQYFDRHLRRVARSVATSVDKSYTSTNGKRFFRDLMNVESNKHSRESGNVLNKPAQTATQAVNPGSDNHHTTTWQTKKTAQTLIANSQNGKQVTLGSTVNGKIEPILNSPSPISARKPTAPSKIAKTRTINGPSKLGKSKLITIIFDGAKDKLQEKLISKIDEPEEETYWEVVYKSVDQNANKIFQAQTLKEVMEMNKGVIKTGLEPLIFER